MATKAIPVRLSPIQRKEIALSALVDERTLRRCLAGERVRDLSRERIFRALASRGMLSILPTAEPSPKRRAPTPESSGEEGSP